MATSNSDTYLGRTLVTLGSIGGGLTIVVALFAAVQGPKDEAQKAFQEITKEKLKEQADHQYYADKRFDEFTGAYQEKQEKKSYNLGWSNAEAMALRERFDINVQRQDHDLEQTKANIKSEIITMQTLLETRVNGADKRLQEEIGLVRDTLTKLENAVKAADIDTVRERQNSNIKRLEFLEAKMDGGKKAESK